MDTNERASIFAMRLAEEATNEEGCWWISFCDGSKPKGTQFLGVVIVRAKGFAGAIKRAWDIGINPGGEAQGYETDPSGIAPEHMDRLLSKSDLIAAGYIDA